METLYKKVNGKYVECGYTNTPDLYDGVWLVQKRKNSKSTTGLIWKLGDIPMADVNLFVSILKFDDELSTYLLRLTQEDSKEYKEAKEHFGEWIKGPLHIYEWSIRDLTMVILKKLGQLIQNEKEEMQFTNRAMANSRKQKLAYITKKVVIESIIEKIKNNPDDESYEKLKNINQDIIDEFLLKLE